MKKTILVIILAVMICSLCLGVVACTDNESGNNKKAEEIKLTVWASQEDQALVKELCARFAATNPDKTYKFFYGIQGENDAADKVLNDTTTGPDVFAFASDQINKLYQGGALASVPKKMTETLKAENTEGSIDAATLTIEGQDKLYAFPSTGDNCYFLYYDKRVFSESDVQSLDVMLEKANEQGKKVHFKLHDDGWYLSSFFFAMDSLKYTVEYDSNMQEKNITLNYNDSDGLKVMKALREYSKNSALQMTTDDSKIIAGFTPDASGKTTACAAVSGTWNAKQIKELLGDNMGVAILPHVTIDGESVQLSGFMGYKLIGVNGFSKNISESMKLAQFLTNEASQLLRYEVRGFGPTNKKVADMDVIKNDEVISVVMAQAQLNRTQKGVPTTYWTPMSALIKDLASGEEVDDATLQSLLDNLVDQVNRSSK